MVLAEQRAAIQIIAPDQIGRAHKRAAGDLFAQGKRDVFAVLAGQRQQDLGCMGRVVEHQVELANRFVGGLFGALFKRAFRLPIEDDGPQQDWKQTTDQGDSNPEVALVSFGFQWHSQNLLQ
ncbi:hypothetical protein D3C72_1426430 [compost metagenome]